MCFIIAFSTLGFSSEKPREVQPKKICLNMIVKNEKDVIERCLASVKPLIDYWVIVDTGSHDGTQDIIKKCMSDIPGELYERPWVDFATNRNEALSLAKTKADYIFFIDADEILEFSSDFSSQALCDDCYYITVRQEGVVDFLRMGLVKSQLDWKWEGVLHEMIYSPQIKTSSVLKGVLNVCNSGQLGARSKDVDYIQKYLRDAKILEEALKKEPTNSRYMYYLGQSYLSAQNYPLAINAFKKRTQMQSKDIQETYIALYHTAVAYEQSGDVDSAIESYFKAFEFNSKRAEPLMHSAVLYRQKGNIFLGYLLSKYALSLSPPKMDICVEYKCYDYETLVEFANCALLLGKFDEGLDACSRLLANPNLPAEMRDKVLANADLARRNLNCAQTPKMIAAPCGESS